MRLRSIHLPHYLIIWQKGSLKVRHLIRVIFSPIFSILVAVIELETGAETKSKHVFS